MDGGKSCRTAGKVCAGLGRGRTCRLRRRFEIAVLWGLANFGARRFPKGERKALWCARRRILIAPAGLTRRLRRRPVGLPPRGGQYFLSKRKKVPKKARGTATTGKRLLLPILPAGLAMSRAMELDSFHLRLERARARLFPSSKWAGLFPSAAYRRSSPPQAALGRLKWRCLGRFCVAWIFLLHKRPA